MRGVILGAGRGSRMGPLTADRPKCLLRVGGSTLLDRQLAALRRAAIARIAVVTGWQADRFDGRGLRLFHNREWAGSSMVDSLACAADWLRAGPTVVCYGDIVVSPAAVRAVAANPAAIAVAYDPQWLGQWADRFADPLTDAETFRLAPDGTIADIGNTPHSIDDVAGQYLGLLKLTPDGWAAIAAALPELAPGERRDMTALLYRLITTQAATVTAVAVPGPWWEFDAPHDLAAGRPVIEQLDRLLA